MARLIERISGTNPIGDCMTLATSYEHAYDEYTVKVSINGIRMPNQDYFTNERSDAESTARDMLARFQSFDPRSIEMRIVQEGIADIGWIVEFAKRDGKEVCLSIRPKNTTHEITLRIPLKVLALIQAAMESE